MTVDGLQPVAVIYHDAVPINAQVRSPNHAAIVRRHHRHMRGHSQVESEMHLLVHFLAFVDITAHIGEVRFYL